MSVVLTLTEDFKKDDKILKNVKADSGKKLIYLVLILTLFVMI